jgi:DNA-binding transcriptional ArsR family regulator
MVMLWIIILDSFQQFVYHRTMNVHNDPPSGDVVLSQVAAAIAEPARTRMLCCLMDGHARTATELAVVAQVSASTASAHLARLKTNQLVEVMAQGKHRYYRLAGQQVGAAIEALLVIANGKLTPFVPSTPDRLREARTCYDHLAGKVAVAAHDALRSNGWLISLEISNKTEYQLTEQGEVALKTLGIDIADTRYKRRRFACACMDWSERKPHLGGALGAALLKFAITNGWVIGDLDSRAMTFTSKGKSALQKHLNFSC